MKKTLRCFLFILCISVFGNEQDKHDFAGTAFIGRKILTGKGAMPRSSGIHRHFGRIETELPKWDSKTAEQELERLEMQLFLESAPTTATSRSPNIGWYTASRTEEFKEEIPKCFEDWDLNEKALKTRGIHVSTAFERSRIRHYLKRNEGKHILPSDPVADQAYAFYKQTAEEKFRLCAQPLNYEYELTALRETAKLQKQNIRQEAAKIANLLKSWKNACNSGNFKAAYQREQQTETAFANLKKKLFTAKDSSSILYPGVSFYSAGIFSFEGNWQSMLTTNVRNTSLYLNAKTEHRQFQNNDTPWEFSFGLPGAVLNRFETVESSWTYSHRKNYFSKGNSESVMECWWSILAPGTLFSTNEPEISAGTLDAYENPDAVAGVFHGKIQIFSTKDKIPVEEMSEGWLLLLWTESSIPKIPMLLFFENKPESIKMQNGFIIGRKAGIGKFAAAPLYGSAPRQEEFGRGWKSVPAEVVRQCRAIADKLAYYPLDCDEFFSIDKNKVKIFNRITKAIRLDGNWSHKAKKYIPIPPVYTISQYNQVAYKQTISKPLVATRFGFFCTADGSELEYTVPAPDLLERFVLAPGGEEKLINRYNHVLQLKNEHTPAVEGQVRIAFADLIRYVDGLALMTPATKKRMDMFGENPGELQRYLLGETGSTWVTTSRGRTVPDFLVDPVTGRSAWFSGWRGNIGGAPIRGDMTCFNMAPMSAFYANAVLYNRWNLVEQYWKQILKYYSAVKFNHPWQVPGMNCLSSGIIVYGDMYGDGFRCYNLMYRLALGTGNKDLAAEALYQAAKQNITTINMVSPNVIVYNAHLKNLKSPSVDFNGSRNLGGPASQNAALSQLGVCQYGFVTSPWKPYVKDSWNSTWQTAGSQGFDYPFFGMMLRYAHLDTKIWNEIFMKELPEWNRLSYMAEASSWCRFAQAWNLIKYLAFIDRDRAKIRKYFDNAFPSQYSKKTPPCPEVTAWWNRVNQIYGYMRQELSAYGNTMPHIIAQNDPLWIGDFGRAQLISGTYDRQKFKGRIQLISEKKDILTVVSMAAPEKISVNGKNTTVKKSVLWELAYEIPLEKGINDVIVQLPECSPEAYPFPRQEKSKVPPLNLEKAPAPGSGELKRKNFKPGLAVQLDLSKYCTTGFSDSPVNMVRKEFWKFPAADTICGVPFRFVDPAKNNGKSMILLRGNMHAEFPAEVKNIPVKKVVKRIYFLHGACYAKIGQKVMTYCLNFADGQKVNLDVVNGRNTGEWKIPPKGKHFNLLPSAFPGNIYPPVEKGQWGEGAGGYLYVWENNVHALGITNQTVDQQGMAKLESIDIISAGQAVPIVFAITVEE